MPRAWSCAGSRYCSRGQEIQDPVLAAWEDIGMLFSSALQYWTSHDEEVAPAAQIVGQQAAGSIAQDADEEAAVAEFVAGARSTPELQKLLSSSLLVALKLTEIQPKVLGDLGALKLSSVQLNGITLSFLSYRTASIIITKRWLPLVVLSSAVAALAFLICLAEPWCGMEQAAARNAREPSPLEDRRADSSAEEGDKPRSNVQPIRGSERFVRAPRAVFPSGALATFPKEAPPRSPYARQ